MELEEPTHEEKKRKRGEQPAAYSFKEKIDKSAHKKSQTFLVHCTEKKRKCIPIAYYRKEELTKQREEESQAI